MYWKCVWSVGEGDYCYMQEYEKKSKWEIRENEDRKERRKKMSGKYLIYLCIFVWFTILTFIILVKYFTAVILKIIEFTYRVSVRSNSHRVSGLNMFKQG